MQANTLQSNFAHQLGDPSAYPIRRIVLPRGLAENEVVVGVTSAEHRAVFLLLDSVLLQDLEPPLWHRYAPRLFRFCTLDAKTSLGLFQRFRNVQQTGLEIEIRPLEGEQFTAAASCRRRHDDEGIKPRIARLLEQGLERPLIEDRWSPLRQLWKENAPVRHRMRDLQHAQAIGVGEHRVQEGANVPDRLWRERPPIRFRLGASAAVILHMVNGLLDLSRRQDIQGRLTDLSDQVRSQL